MTTRYRNVQAIINPASGGDEPMLNILNDVFGQYGIPWDARITHATGDATALTRAALDAGCDLVVSYGGDGTVMEVANGMMGSDVPLGILPGGTANAVATELGIPTALRDAVQVICESSTRRKLDVGRAGDRYFLLRVYTGIPGEYTATRELKDRFGLLAYPLSALRLLRERSSVRFHIEVDEQIIEEEGLLCFVNNIAYARTPRLQAWVERFFLDVRAHDGESAVSIHEPVLHTIDPSDGLLDVLLLAPESLTLASLANALVRTEETVARAHLFQGKRIHLDADPPQPVGIDGETLGDTPVTIEVIPQAIEVIVPNAQ
jgi:diacylglycerol kinase family enzyme